jgi:adenylate cyclase
VVDDNLTNLEVLRVRLNAHGYEVVTAVDGEDALRRARELEPDLALLDIMMPRLDGISVLAETKPLSEARIIELLTWQNLFRVN